MSELSPLHGRMVFVVGAPRSGTMWLQRMLGVHPAVVCMPSETHLFSVGLSTLRDQAQGYLLDSPSTTSYFMPPEEFAAAARAFADAAFGAYVQRVHPSALRVIERSPSHVWHLGLISAIYPDAYVVHIIRDGRDVARSLVAQSWGPPDLESAAQMWASSVRAARAAAPDVPRYLEVRYEDLLAQPGSIESVFRFLELPNADATVDLALIEGGRAANVDPTRPDVAVGKWQREWSAADLEAFDSAAGETLRSLGYPSADPAAQQVARPVEQPGAPALGRRRWAGRAAAALRPSSAPETFRPVAERWQELVTEVVGALATADTGLLRQLVPHVAEVTVEGPTTGWRLNGGQALDRLVADVDSEGPWGEPLRGDQSIDGRTWTIVLSHRGADGVLVDRLLALSVTAESVVERLRYYRFPLRERAASASEPNRPRRDQ